MVTAKSLWKLLYPPVSAFSSSLLLVDVFLVRMWAWLWFCVNFLQVYVGGRCPSFGSHLSLCMQLPPSVFLTTFIHVPIYVGFWDQGHDPLCIPNVWKIACALEIIGSQKKKKRRGGKKGLCQIWGLCQPLKANVYLFT